MNESTLSEVQHLARTVAAANAASVDANARFPVETITALRDLGLLSAQVPADMGGLGLSMFALGAIVSTLAEHCASSAMVLAMHYNQVACLVRHGAGNAAITTFLGALPQTQALVASMTSEVGTSGDTRRSVCAVETTGDAFRLIKEATAGSYCEHADAILITARRHARASPNDQVLVFAKREQIQLTRTSTWDTFGMRGTCSPGFRLESQGPSSQVLSTPFEEIASMSMVPYSHILWAALWTGIANGALRKAATFVRQQARQNPGVIPPGAGALAQLDVELHAMRHNWRALANDFDSLLRDGTGATELATPRWALRLNHLKIACSEAAPAIVMGALKLVGMPAYQNDGPFAMGRALRDALSAPLMISNTRIQLASASLLLVAREE